MSSFYSRAVYPYLMDVVLKCRGGPRSATLDNARGDVLEVGFGTGLNLTHYPSAVRSLCALDVSSPLPRRVKRRMRQVTFPVEQRVVMPAKHFPLPDHRYDCVVTTWTLCSVSDVPNLLSEIRRVLRPDGIYLFLEHGAAHSGRLTSLQRRLSKVTSALANGCRLDLPIDGLIREAGFTIIELEQLGKASIFSLANQIYRGVAAQSLTDKEAAS